MYWYSDAEKNAGIENLVKKGAKERDYIENYNCTEWKRPPRHHLRLETIFGLYID